MNLNVALTVAKNVGWNTLVGTGHFAAGLAIAITIKTIADRVIKPGRNSPIAHTIRFFAMTAGICVSLYFVPKTALVTFTANQAFKLIALQAALEVSSKIVFKSHIAHIVLRPITFGAMVGYFGTPALAAFGAVGAVMGANFDRFASKV